MHLRSSYYNDNNINPQNSYSSYKYTQKVVVNTHYTVDEDGKITFHEITKDIEKDGIDPTALNYNKIINNNYFIEIPISFGLILRQNKISLLSQASIIPSFHLSSSGNTLNENKEVVKIENSNYSAINLSYALSFRIFYDINKNKKVFVEPFIQNSISSINNRSKDNKNYFSFYGIKIGFSIY